MSTFSLYDAFAGQDDEEAAFKKRTLNLTMKVDPHIFKDVATNSSLAPNEESLTEEVQK
jgi:hypothetical protein